MMMLLQTQRNNSTHWLRRRFLVPGEKPGAVRRNDIVRYTGLVMVNVLGHKDVNGDPTLSHRLKFDSVNNRETLGGIR
jgi:hypothetical protein